MYQPLQCYDCCLLLINSFRLYVYFCLFICLLFINLFIYFLGHVICLIEHDKMRHLLGFSVKFTFIFFNFFIPLSLFE